MPLLVPSTLMAVLWPIKTWAYTGNPFYPMFWKVFGGPDWSPALAEQFTRWQQGIGMGREPMDYLLLPWRVILYGEYGYDHFDGKIAELWLVALPLAIWAAWPLRNGRRALAAALGLSVFWALSSQQIRFLIPVLALLSWVLAQGLHHRLGGLNSPTWTRLKRPLTLLVPGVVALFIVLWTRYPTFVKSGVQHARIFNTPQFSTSMTVPPVAPVINDLPEDSKVLLLKTNQRFSYERDLLVDSFFIEASQITDWLQVCGDKDCVDSQLRQRKVSHILLGIPKKPLRFPYPQVLMAYVSDSRRVEIVHRDPAHILLALRPSQDEVDPR